MSVTQILARMQEGDRRAAGELMPLVYGELRKLAEIRLANERAGHTLQATALVHEAYLRLVGEEDKPVWENRRHFFGAAAEAMRRILIESARRQAAIKRGEGGAKVPLEEAFLVIEEPDIDLLALDEALERLGETDPPAAELVRLRYFAGLTHSEAADVLGLPLRTVERTWTYARAWLLRALQEPAGSGENLENSGGERSPTTHEE
ncbi:sigma-70 family RNA polymerase sigma factor [Planctomyces sp. SH-PL14]|uniref:sigma-70 family RNA polymerase sigma factor n=1 Tax=Planctomyces sp. SH-PL14 TaxID=1632864 RepID=UPI00078C15AF|nr:sigma-70 family RNA polymerase sigma factor [Planctomyces sp. SH-PL14]AMV19368.1 RNA polymerase sigma factor [Planctomyces sp. SH-PL14]